MARAAEGRKTTKSATAYRTISEVADEIDVPAHVLRFWEGKFPSVKPLKRGGGRRYYRPEDVEALRRIRKLLYEDGFTIRGVQKLLKTHGGTPPAGVALADDAVPVPASPPPVESAAPAEPEVGQGMLDLGLTARQVDRLRVLLGELKSIRADLKAAA